MFVPVLLALLGLGALVASGTLFPQARHAANGTHVTGTVVAISTSTGGREGQTGFATRKRWYAPVVEYRALDGTMHKVTPTLSGSNLPVLGASVDVSYDPDRPERAVVTVPGQAAAKWLFFVVGAAAVIGAVLMWQRNR